MPMNDPSRITIFLSHSSKDFPKIREIRSILEALDYEPLAFCFHCLDDDNQELEDFLKREIDARHIFLYCKSENAEKSPWVRKELDYIKQSKKRYTRYYELDIDKPLKDNLPSLLMLLSEIIHQNTLYVSVASKDMELSNNITSIFNKAGYNAKKYNDHTSQEYERSGRHDLLSAIKNGIFVGVITYAYLKSMYCMAELERAAYIENDKDFDNIYLFIVNLKADFILNRYPFISRCHIIEIESEDNTIDKETEEKILRAISKGNENGY